MTSTEETPILTGTTSISDPEILKHDLLYQRFSPSQKRTIVALISYAAVIPCEYLLPHSLSQHGIVALLKCILLVLASGSFIPSIPEISKDLGTSGSVIRCGVHRLVLIPLISYLFWHRNE